jgi:hypothetical protein
MLVYHRTNHSATILKDGFRDGYYLMPGIGELYGVFVSAGGPLDENEGADGDVVLELDIPDALFVEYEHVEEGKTYREAMIPAGELNRYSVRRVLNEEDVLSEPFRARTVPTPVPTSEIKNAD